MNYILKDHETMEDVLRRLVATFEWVQNVAPIAYWYEDLYENGRLKSIHYSARMREMLGYASEEEFPDRLETLTSHIHPDDVQLMLDSAIAAGTGKTDSYDVQYRIRRADGTYMWVNATGQVIRNTAGTTVGMYGAFIDISGEIALQQERLEQQRSKEIIDYFAKNYEAAFLGDLRDGSYTLISARNDISDSFPGSNTLPEAFGSYFARVTHPADLRNLEAQGIRFENIRERLAVGGSHSMEFRRRVGDDYYWYRVVIDRINEDQLLIGFTNCDDEHTYAVLSEKLMDEYDAIYVVSLDRNRIRSVRRSRVSAAGAFEGGMNYTEAVLRFAGTVAPQYRKDWNDFSDPAFMKRYMAKDDHREYVYELPGAGRTMRRFSIDVIERLDGEAKSLLFSFVGIDDTRAEAIRLHRRLAEQNAFTSYFLEPYISAYYISFNNLSYQVYKRTKQMDEDYPVIGSYVESVSEYIMKDVVPEDREEFLRLVQPETMKAMLAEKPSFSYMFRSTYSGEEKNLLFQVIRGADEDHAAFGFRNIDSELAREREQEKRLRENFEIIGILASEYSSVYYIDLTTDGLTPYTMNESTENAFGQIFRSDISYSEAYRLYVSRLVSSEDRAMMLNAGSLRNIMKELRDKKTFLTTYRDADGRYCEMKFVKVGAETDKPLAVALGFADRDDELRKKREAETVRQRNTDIIGILASEYSSVYYIDLTTEELDPYTMNAETESEFGRIFRSGIKYSDAYRLYVNTLVYDEDKARMLRAGSVYNILKELRDKKTFLTTYRDAEGRYCEMKFVKVGEEENPQAVALGFADKDDELREDMQRRAIAARDAAVIAGLSDDFGCVVYYNVEIGAEIHYRFDPLLSAGIPGWEEISNFDVRMKTLADTLVHPDDRKLLENPRESKKTVQEIIRREGVFYHNFRIILLGETRYYQLKIVRDESSSTHLIAGLRNVDETVRREMEYQEKLELANRSKTDFLFNMSHDIRTPMNAIIGFTRMAKKKPEDTERVLDCLNKIEVSGGHLLELINEVLDMSRVEAGKLRSDMKTVNIAEAGRALLTISRENAEAQGITLRYQEKNIVHPVVLADELHVNQIVMNVLGNAIKYTPPGGAVTYTVEETASEVPGYGRYVLTIEDTGMGMSGEFLEHIFDAFSREDKATTSEIQGTGLGMAIVKRLVDYLDGTIAIRSEQGKGTCVEIAFHWLLTDAAGTAAKAEHTAVDLSGKRVLLVEDNELNREIATEILEEQGLTIETAVNGVDAVSRVRERGADHYDFILMDIQMPLMDGFTATAEIRKLPGTEKLPIIALSANAFEEDRAKSLAAGMNAHVAKPIVIADLIAALAGFVK